MIGRGPLPSGFRDNPLRTRQLWRGETGRAGRDSRFVREKLIVRCSGGSAEARPLGPVAGTRVADLEHRADHGSSGLITEVNMAVEAIEREIGGAHLRLAEAAAAARHGERHYLDRRGPGSLLGPATALAAAHPWALAGFGDPAWAAYRPDPRAA